MAAFCASVSVRVWTPAASSFFRSRSIANSYADLGPLLSATGPPLRSADAVGLPCARRTRRAPCILSKTVTPSVAMKLALIALLSAATIDLAAQAVGGADKARPVSGDPGISSMVVVDQP